MELVNLLSTVGGIILIIIIPVNFAANCRGCTTLDSLTFDKIISKFTTTLVKFDNHHAYTGGPEYKTYSQIALDLAEIDDLIVGEVELIDYDKKDNQDLAARYDIVKEQYSPERQRPVLMLFQKDKATGGALQHFKFSEEEDYDVDSIKHFIRQKSRISITLPGCIREFDLYAQMFLGSGNAGEKGKAMALAEKALLRFKHNGEEKFTADIYVKIMRKIVKDGNKFANIEMRRVKKLLSGGKQSDKKRMQLEQRINIIRSFMQGEDIVNHENGKF